MEEIYPDKIPLNIDIWVGIIGVIVVVSMFFTFYHSFKGLFKHLFSGGKKNKILQIGRPAKIKILNIKESNEGVVTINDQPFVALEVEVDDGSSKYRTEIKTVIGRLDVPKFQPGKIFAVKIDPNNKMNVVFDPEKEVLKHKNK
ncbi:MAG: hypothetical protein HQ538_04715 [Parcubacteria group bacterium]|nr:hypothetical protein [Parcubacteria group bacterium]